MILAGRLANYPSYPNPVQSAIYGYSTNSLLMQWFSFMVIDMKSLFFFKKKNIYSITIHKYIDMWNHRIVLPIDL